MKSRIVLCLLLIMTVLTFGACADTTPENVVDDNDNYVQDDVNRAVDDAQDDMNDMNSKDMTDGLTDNNPNDSNTTND